MTTARLFWWYSCPECESTWGSDSPFANREWCPNSCVPEPELIHEEQVGWES